MSSSVRRFLFEGLDIRGAFVRLDEAWVAMQAGRDYPAPVAGLLGEVMAVTALIGAQLKQPGRLTLQLRGQGPIQLLVMDCNEQLQMRGMARSQPVVLPAPVPTLLGAAQGGQLMLSLDLPTARQPYQSFVPMDGENIGEIFEHYLEQSEQLASQLITRADTGTAACLFLQKLPDADQRDPDGWARVTQLAATVRDAELLGLEADTLLQRLFNEEIAAGGIRIYDEQPVVYHCPADRQKMLDLIRSLGRADVEATLADQGRIHVRDDICNHDYYFDAEDIAALFDGDAQAPHH